MFLSKKFRLLPHMFTLNLFLAQVSTLKKNKKYRSTCQLSRVSYNFLSVNPQIVLVWSPVLVMHRDDRLELCGERG